MALHFNDGRFMEETIGMPASHADKFQQVSRMQNTVIVCRAPGPTCCQLLKEGYDTKGFRVHAKSCDWGPMAGFVLRDPRLNKKGDAVFNTRAHAESLQDTNHADWAAGTVPLKLYPERVAWLRTNNIINVAPALGRHDALVGTVRHRSGVFFAYCLFLETLQGRKVFGVYIDNRTFTQEVGGAARVLFPYSTYFEAMMAMTNPFSHASYPRGDFRNAITGDYDLFAAWPHRTIYERYGADRRILGTTRVMTHSARVDHMEEDFVRVPDGHGGRRAQATKLGNITNRLYEICQYLNSMIAGAVSDNQVPGPHDKRMVCWHSDENARPGVSDVDLPLIAFAPSGAVIGIENIEDFRQFIEMCLRDGYYVTLAEGWVGPNPDKPNRLPPRYFRLIPDSYFTRDGALERMTLPSWYNA